MIFLALILLPVLAHKHPLDEWIGTNVNWDSKTEPFMAAEMTLIDQKVSSTVFLTKKSETEEAKSTALRDPTKPKKPFNQPFNQKVNILQRRVSSEKRKIKHLIYVLTHLFQNWNCFFYKIEIKFKILKIIYFSIVMIFLIQRWQWYVYTYDPYGTTPYIRDWH